MTLNPRRWGMALAVAVGGTSVIGLLTAALTGLAAGRSGTTPAAVAQAEEVADLRSELAAMRERLAQAESQVRRAEAVARYSALYAVPADLAGAIYDNALAEGIHPSLGFQLVKVESGFKPGARSERGAIGYTQLRLKTARFYDPKVTEASLLDRDTNLRIGFRFLKDLLEQFDEDLHMALVAYNRGPARVTELLARGEDPSNGYAEIVLRGVKKGS